MKISTIFIAGIGIISFYGRAYPYASVTQCNISFPNTHCATWASDDNSDRTKYVCSCEVCSDGYVLTGSGASNGNYYLYSTCTTIDTGSGTGGSTTPATCPSGTSKCTTCNGPSFTDASGQLWCAGLSTGPVTCPEKPHPAAVAFYFSPCCDSNGYRATKSLSCLAYACNGAGVTHHTNHSTCICATGYYGRVNTDGTGCTKCPSSGGVAGTTSAAGTTSITACYIPADTNMTDSSGTYQFTMPCFYSE